MNNCSSIYHRSGSHTLLEMNANIQQAHGYYNSATTMAGEKSGRSASHSGGLRELKHTTFLNYARQPEVCCFPV